MGMQNRDKNHVNEKVYMIFLFTWSVIKTCSPTNRRGMRKTLKSFSSMCIDKMLLHTYFEFLYRPIMKKSENNDEYFMSNMLHYLYESMGSSLFFYNYK